MKGNGAATVVAAHPKQQKTTRSSSHAQATAQKQPTKKTPGHPRLQSRVAFNLDSDQLPRHPAELKAAMSLPLEDRTRLLDRPPTPFVGEDAESAVGTLPSAAAAASNKHTAKTAAPTKHSAATASVKLADGETTTAKKKPNGKPHRIAETDRLSASSSSVTSSPPVVLPDINGHQVPPPSTLTNGNPLPPNHTSSKGRTLSLGDGNGGSAAQQHSASVDDTAVDGKHKRGGAAQSKRAQLNRNHSDLQFTTTATLPDIQPHRKGVPAAKKNGVKPNSTFFVLEKL